MIQVRPVFVREAALLLAELAQKAEAGEGFAQALDGEGQAGALLDGWARGPAKIRRPQPDRATGFLVHSSQPEGPERAAAPAALAAYAARLAERVVIEGPVAAFSLRV
jgi:hypothetical protein